MLLLLFGKQNTEIQLDLPASLPIYCSQFSFHSIKCSSSLLPYSLSPLDLHLGSHCCYRTSLTSVGKNNGSGWRTIPSTKTPSGEPLIRHRFRCPSRCAYSKEICHHFTSLFWNNTKKINKRWTDLLFLLIPILPGPPTHQSRNTHREMDGQMSNSHRRLLM